ncbi:dnaJ homolog subfamily C member 21-like isoform X2 [Dreissena polymorpha]|uniref:dnaJ homolog subfamily C member 21-like isoform X2 n=1 Tax=Dreissena polymorpha TaxID=45954 RepID=UPI002263F67A|nr:dnaJ homolog subfamily C member 21-like isoform X2 [Dreissena polymorpha]
MAEHRKCLRTLGLQDGATESEIRSAYRKLALQYHPDKNESDDAKERFQEIGYAYKYLTDGPGHVTGSTFEREDDVVINMFREMFFAQFMQQRFGFPFMFDDDSDDDEDYFYSDSEDEEFTHGPFFGCRHRFSHTEPPPPNIYQEESKKQKKKREKRQRQKEKAKEKKEQEKKEQERKSGADSSSTSHPTENAGGPGEIPNPTPSSQEQSVPPTQKLTKKQKKQLETQQRKREEEMKQIAEELLCKQEQEKERQRVKEREKKEREQQEKRDLLKEQEKGPDNPEIPAFYDHGKKSMKARQRERRRQEASASVNPPSSATARPPGSNSQSSTRNNSADTGSTGLSFLNQSESSASSRSSTPLSVPSTVSSTSGTEQNPKKSCSKPQPVSTQKKSQQATRGAKPANIFEVLDDTNDFIENSDLGSSFIKGGPRHDNKANEFCEPRDQDITTQRKLGNSSTSGSPRYNHNDSTLLKGHNSGSNSKSSNAYSGYYSASQGSYSSEPANKGQPPLNGSQACNPSNSGVKNDNHRFYNTNHTSYNGEYGNVTGPNIGSEVPMNSGPFKGQVGPFTTNNRPFTNNHVPYNGGSGPHARNNGPYWANSPYNGGRVYYNTTLENGQSQNGLNNRYTNGLHYSQNSKQAGPRQATPHNTGPRLATSNCTGPRQATSNSTGPRQAASHVTGPRQATPHITGPRQATSHKTGPMQATPHYTGESGQQRPREGQKGLPQFTFGKGGFPIPKNPSAFETESTMAGYGRPPSGQQTNHRKDQQTSFKQVYGQKTVPTNSSIPQTTPLNPQFSNKPSSQSDAKPSMYSRGATLFSFDEPKVATPYGTSTFKSSVSDSVKHCDSMDSLDDFSLYECKGSVPGACSGDLGFGNSVLNSGLGVPAGMFTDSIKNYYK